ncbi:peptidase S41 (plasmid) [Gemmatirosa kalamazoonensis]|uniref:Peptidase S41 n=1 Tax=Gemmatirosa kalamazoonensis TaxID=861299 RepID=W0RU33_9BACT|nr:S41 family peptidase [Gemmatirosa kalamazoonensis]AHG93820.1 peptidase S41 [Gemmatirosa kalamazoonensis]
MSLPRRALLVLLLAVGCRGEPTSPRPATLFDEVWDAFDRHYAFFDLGHIDWTALGAAYRDSVGAATDDRERARLLGAMIGRLNDYHADLATPYGVFGPPPIAYAHHFAPDLVRRGYFAEPVRSTRSGRIYFARLQDGTGYVYIGSFGGSGWGGEIDDALAGLGAVPSIVVDIRDNGGGDERIGQDVAARFYDRTRVYRVTRFRSGSGHGDFGSASSMSLSPAGARRFTGPVALVTNRFDGSSAEDFTLMMRALPHVTTVGDTTLGLGSNPRTMTLSDGWTLRVPQSMQSTPDGFVYQWRGLPPAIAVPWTAADTASGRDPYLDAALAALQRRR